jgi:UDP-N-acetylglucosamine transferase subunit ALG13
MWVKNLLNEGNQIHNVISSSGSGTVIDKNKIKNKIIYFPFYKKYNIIHDRIKCTSHLSLGKNR